MKFLVCLAALLFASCEAGVREFDRDGQLINIAAISQSLDIITQSLASQGTTRVKRSHQKIQCMHRCMSAMSDELKEAGLIPDNWQAATGLFNKQLYDDNALEDYCRISLKGKECLHKCTPEGRQATGQSLMMKKALDVAFRAVDFLCTEKKEEFQAAIPCMAKTAEETGTLCGGQCGNPIEFAAQSAGSIRAAVAATDFGRLGKLLDEQCKFIRCTLKCESRVMMRECDDHSSALLLNDFVGSALRSAQEMLEGLEGGMKFWPPTCRLLARANKPHDEYVHIGQEMSQTSKEQ